MEALGLDIDAKVLLPVEVAVLLEARKALKRRGYSRVWKAEHPKRVRAELAAWKAANPEKVAAYSRKLYLKVWGATRGARPCVACTGRGSWSPKMLDPPHERCVVALSGSTVVFPQLWPLPTIAAPLEAADTFAGASCDPDPWWV